MDNAHSIKVAQRKEEQKSPKQLQASEGALHGQIAQLQEALGNAGTVQMLGIAGSEDSGNAMSQLIQRIEEQEMLQSVPKEEELLQGMPQEQEVLQGAFPEQVQQNLEQEEILQGKGPAPSSGGKAENNTGMPDNLKTGIENLSGTDLSDVKVHYNSSKPSEVGALAYAQGTDIHVGPGQEKHLPHEAWHAVQQRQGRVQATTEVGGMSVNDDPSLEAEADSMGSKALQMVAEPRIQLQEREPIQNIAQFEKKMIDALRGELAAGSSKDTLFDAFTAKLKGASFVYDSSGNADVLDTYAGPANCGKLARALNELFVAFGHAASKGKYPEFVYTPIDGDYIDQTKTGNCKNTAGEDVVAYFFKIHSYLEGYDPTSGKKGADATPKTAAKEKVTALPALAAGTEMGANAGDYEYFYNFTDFIIVSEKVQSERMYVRIELGSLSADLIRLGILKAK